MNPTNTTTENRIAYKALLAVLALLVAAATILVLPPDAEAQVASDEVSVRALSNGHFELDYQLSYQGTFEDIRYFEIWGDEGSWLVYRNQTELMFGPNFTASVVMETPRAYGDAREHCFKVRSHDRFGHVSEYSMNGCAVAATYSAPMDLTVNKDQYRPGHGVLSWSDPDFITMGSVLVQPEWIQIYDGHNYRWVQQRENDPYLLTAGSDNDSGRWKCHIARYWTADLGVSAWSNWACTVL